MIDIDYYKTIAGGEGVTFEMKIALRDLITDVEERLKAIQVQAGVMVQTAEEIIETEIKELEKRANEYNEDMDTTGYINNLNDSNILHRVLIKIKTASSLSK